MRKSRMHFGSDESAVAKLGVLLHPAQPYARPIEVVADPDLTLNEKRTILSSWASDACTIEGTPSLRRAPGSAWIVSIDEILEALRTLDKQAGEPWPSQTRRQVRRASIEAFRVKRMWLPGPAEAGRLN